MTELSQYKLENIKEHKESFSKTHKPRNFLRRHTEYINFLKSIFGDLQNSELNFLISNNPQECIDCHSPTQFINHDNGYKERCHYCIMNNSSKSISKSMTNRRIKTKCPRCENESINNSLCNECKNTFKCIYCDMYIQNEKKSKFTMGRPVCDSCELDYLVSSDLRTYCDVDHYQFKQCEICNVLFKYRLGGVTNTKCKKHRKQCKVCDNFYEKQGATCSKECSNILHKETYLEKYGEIINLNVRGSKRSHKEYWLNKGYSLEESLFKVYKSQSYGISEFETYEDLEIHFNDNIHIIKEYTLDISKYIICSNRKMLCKLLEVFIDNNNLVIGSSCIKMKPNTYGTLCFISNNDEFTILRSKKEFFFYSLLQDNDTEFLTNKKYKDSDHYYDFYLPEYDEYIEITGFMGNQTYVDKMEYKKDKFGSILLNTNEEMIQYINGLKERNEVY